MFTERLELIELINSKRSVTDEKYKPQFLAQKASNQPRKPSNNDQ